MGSGSKLGSDFLGSRVRFSRCALARSLQGPAFEPGPILRFRIASNVSGIEVMPQRPGSHADLAGGLLLRSPLSLMRRRTSARTSFVIGLESLRGGYSVRRETCPRVQMQDVDPLCQLACRSRWSIGRATLVVRQRGRAQDSERRVTSLRALGPDCAVDTVGGHSRTSSDRRQTRGRCGPHQRERSQEKGSSSGHQSMRPAIRTAYPRDSRSPLSDLA